MEESKSRISGIIFDLVMPVMNGYEFLEAVRDIPKYANIPIIVATGNGDNENEIKALELGAWDFASKPYNPTILRFRLKNAIERSQMAAFERLKYLAEYDKLTGIYNKSKFFSESSEFIQNSDEKEFTFIRIDIVHFQLINSYFGLKQGDNLLRYIADKLTDMSKIYNFYYGRIESDIFGICCAHKNDNLDEILATIRKSLEGFNEDYNILPCVGVYYFKDKKLSMDTVFDRATLAAKTCKGNYINYYAIYNDNMSDDIQREQEIVNNMSQALEEDQFCVYFQPKYDLATNRPAGAEALVRWKHPEIGMISPGVFIPIFERNGFISKLDYYVWEKVCQHMRRWADEGIKSLPVSVNVSRVDLYNPRLVENICELVEKYEIPKDLFNLELTESAYTDNPKAIIEIMDHFQEKGFKLMMDDFGSGYSSLNVLKDMRFDFLKIDMKFMEKTRYTGRGENILASVVCMAKWLKMPVIAEGVETGEQVRFLRSIGCEYVQGYYFAKPMALEDYETLIRKQEKYTNSNENSNIDFNTDSIWQTGNELDNIFSGILQPTAIYEYEKGHVELLRVNDSFCSLLGTDAISFKSNDPLQVVDEKYRDVVVQAFEEAVNSKDRAECEYIRMTEDKGARWINIKLKYINQVGNRCILFGAVNDITEHKMIDSELKKYQQALDNSLSNDYTMLVTDDLEINREIIKEIFADKYTVLQAENGEQALDIIRSQPVDIILLDMSMPVMDGVEFLKIKNNDNSIKDIPVIVITVEDKRSTQVEAMEMGVDDYIVKPFVPEVVEKRVNNVLKSSNIKRNTL